MKQLIFQLGTNNWLRGSAIARNSASEYECYHEALNQLPDTVAYSMYPSQAQASKKSLVTVFQAPHVVSNEEPALPAISYRLESMSDRDVHNIRLLLGRYATEAIRRAEDAEGIAVSTAIANSSFLNLLVLLDINRARAKAGLQTFNVLCNVHGSAPNLFGSKQEESNSEFPSRFLPLMHAEGMFDPVRGVDACAAVETKLLDGISNTFPAFPSERLIVSTGSYNQQAFNYKRYTALERNRILQRLDVARNPDTQPSPCICSDTDAVVVFCGDLSDRGRLETLLEAAQTYEKQNNYATLVISSGRRDSLDHYLRVAYERLKLKNTWFISPQSQAKPAQLYALADVGINLSPIGCFEQTLVECMAVGTPVISTCDGGLPGVITDEIGALLTDTEGPQLARTLSKEICSAISESWKVSKGKAAANVAQSRFSVLAQIGLLMRNFEKITNEMADVRRAS